MSSISESSQSVNSDSEVELKKESCVKHVDALWFCYSPFYQMHQYYREGEFDSCFEKWSALTDCMLLRTAARPRIQAKLAEQEKKPPHMWETRSPEEAALVWEAQFGHLKDK